jgi:N-acyl-phosphatidylethanolamine-hydrolysing phospholipase D
MAVLAGAVVLASCSLNGGQQDEGVLPPPVRDIAIAGVALGAALNLHPKDGKPAVMALTREAFADNRLTWLGHSSFLVRVGGKSLLLDPMFSNYPEFPVPVRLRRISAVPPGIEKLDRLDAVVISHADHDHLDLPTLRSLAEKFPDALLLAPTGTRDIAMRSGFRNYGELGVYGTRQLGSVALTALPAEHYGRRDMIGLRRRLAVGWEIAAAGRKIYFSGDTGYSDIFDEIRRKRGRFDVALVPIGAFAPEPVFRETHASPEKALLIASKLGARLAIGHHWGTFAFGVAAPREARERFLAARAPGVTPRALAIGETIRLPAGR